MRLIKLTDSEGYTRRGLSSETEWLPIGTRPPRLEGEKLCAQGVYHAYSSPEQAVMMDPIHVRLLPCGRAWWAEGEVVVSDETKVGCHELTLVEPAELPELSTAVRVRAAIYCAIAAGVGDVGFAAWAERWLSGEDRSPEAARTVAGSWTIAAAAAAAAATAWAAQEATAWAAQEVAAWAAQAVEQAVKAAYTAASTLDLTEIVIRAIADEAEMTPQGAE